MKSSRIASILWLGCSVWGCGAGEGPRAVFPDSAPSAVLPIRDPIDGPELEVEIELVHDSRRERLWTVVDSGFTGVSIPERVARLLDLDDIGRAQTHGIAGSVVESVGRADMVLGPLVVSDVVLNRSKTLSVLGQPILSHSPWEVSWTRGTLTLGATPWQTDPTTVRVPLQPRADSEIDELEVRVQGHQQLMMFDTGAVASTIPESRGDALGLPSEPFEGIFGGAAGSVLVSRAFVADLVVAGFEIRGKRLLALKNRAWGLLGRDVLYRYDFLVTPGKSVAFRPRGDLARTAAARIARWHFIDSSCAKPGCVTARIEHEGEQGRLQLDVEAELERPGRMVFACADGASVPLVSMSALLAQGTIEGPFHHVVLDYDRLQRGRYQVRVPHAGSFWFANDGTGCNDLVLLDLVPLGNGQPIPAGVAASLRP